MPGRIDLESSPEDRRRERWLGRLGYLALGLFVPLAAIGFFGGGSLWAATETAGGAVLQYPGVCRAHHEFELQLWLPAGAQNVRIPAALFDRIELCGAIPAPELESAEGDQVILSFSNVAVASTSALRLRLKADRPGRVQSEIAVQDQGMLPLNIWVLP